MICPNEKCRKEIPDDSLFCDQCGKPLKGYDNNQRNKIIKLCSDYINSHHHSKKEKKSLVVNNYNDEDNKNDYCQEFISKDNEQTNFFMNVPTLKLKHEKIVLTITKECIIGRETNPYGNVLSNFSFISRRHAKFIVVDNNWMIIDLNSTNSSYINGNRLKANTPYEIHDGDRLSLGPVDFIASILENP